MSYTLRFQPKALKDIENILPYLSELHADLPHKFRNLLAEKLEEVGNYPERWAPLSNGIRAIRMKLSKRLAYHCFYTIREHDNHILILRILPQQADPKHWPS